jgi:hypothetical protein
MEDWLAATLDLHGGGSERFGPDERDAERRLIRASFATQNPGGFGDGTLVVARPRIVSALDAQRFASGRFYGPGNRTAYEGRVRGIPRVGANEIEIQFEGWINHADDDVFCEIFVDPDLGAWGEPSTQRRINLFNASPRRKHSGSVEVTPDQSGSPALSLTQDRLFTDANQRARTEAWLDALGIELGSIYYSYGPDVDLGGFDSLLHLSDDDLGTNTDATANLATTTSTGTLSASGVAKKFAIIWLERTANATADGEWKALWKLLVRYGAHGLTKRGTESATTWKGFYVPDMIAHALRKGAPLLNFTEGPDGSIEPASFPVPNAKFTDVGNTVRKTVETLNLYGGDGLVPNDFGVYEDREFFWRTPGSHGLSWRLRKDVNVVPSDEGPGGDPVNAAVVTYTDGARAEHTLYPEDDARLLDTDPDNPVNAAGIPRKVLPVQAGLTSEEGAARISQLSMEEANRDERQGSLVVTGPVRTADGAEYPPWRVRACDHSGIEEDVEVPDARILTTDYTHDANTRRLTGSVGAAPHRVEVLLAQLRSAVGG